MVAPAWGTVYVNLDLESSTVNAAITNSSTHDGSLIELFSGDPAYPTPFTRNAITTPSGVRYHEVLTICGGYSGSRCTPGNDPTVTTNQAGFVTHHTAIDWTTKTGQTFYLGGFFRFDRVGGRNVWAADTFDKLWEFGGNGSDHSTRWDSANTFTFDLWCAASVFSACENTGINDFDHKPANVSPYSGSNPYECNFEQWYAVVLAITMNTSSSGVIKMYINGTLIHDSTHVTMDTGIVSSDGATLHGTIAQPAYDAPDHYRRSDKLMFTDNLTDIQNAGLMSDPNGGGGGRVTMFIEQSTVIATAVAALQYLMILAFLWEQRQKAIRALMLLRAAYWRIRYSRAVAKWQRDAPLMLESRGEHVDLTRQQEQDAWQFRK
jgi:hypothetical protein